MKKLLMLAVLLSGCRATGEVGVEYRIEQGEETVVAMGKVVLE